MKSFIVLVFLLSAFNFRISLSQKPPDPALVYINEIQYVSPFEKEVLHDFIVNNSQDFFSLFLCIDSSMTWQEAGEYKTTFNSTIGQFKNSYYQNMNEKKKVGKIYSVIHDELLDKYTVRVPFSSVFASREYQCVSSSMLFALAFDTLNIPYEIRLTPDHSYLVAYPKTEYITVETTDPLHGAIIYDQTFKAKFVEYLRDAKLISKEEYNSKSVEELFEEHYNKTETISLAGLASVQYSNQTLAEFENLRYGNAAQMQEKAWLLNPDETNTYLLLASWLMNYSQIEKNNIQCVTQLGKLTRFQTKGVRPEVVISEFAQITQRQLLYEGDEVLYDSSYHLLMEYVSDSTLRNELSFIYNYERGRLLCNELEYQEALPYTKKAFRLKQKNTDAKNNLLFAIGNSIETEEPIKRMELVNQIAEEIPVLVEDNIFTQLRLSMYLLMVDLSFYEKHATEGERYLKEFEQLYPQRNIKYHLLDGDIENAYGSAASYYFRLGQTGRSSAVLEKGLSYVPNSFALKNRLNALK